ncbi:unnamed protein product, partial [Urochloa humidicola]
PPAHHSRNRAWPPPPCSPLSPLPPSSLRHSRLLWIRHGECRARSHRAASPRPRRAASPKPRTLVAPGLRIPVLPSGRMVPRRHEVRAVTPRASFVCRLGLALPPPPPQIRHHPLDLPSAAPPSGSASASASPPFSKEPSLPPSLYPAASIHSSSSVSVGAGVLGELVVFCWICLRGVRASELKPGRVGDEQWLAMGMQSSGPPALQSTNGPDSPCVLPAAVQSPFLSTRTDQVLLVYWNFATFASGV